jgi:hypothetical protein
MVKTAHNNIAHLEKIETALERAMCMLRALSYDTPANDQGDMLDETLLCIARKMVRERKLRNSFFPSDFFCEPVWDILLDLYIAYSLGKKISVSSTCLAAGVPQTTALRYLKMMTDGGFVVRTLPRKDARLVYVKLSDNMNSAMRNYLMRVM